MYGNGAMTGMLVAIIVAVRQAILQAHHLALTAWPVAAAGAATAAGATMLSTAEYRFVAATTLATSPTVKGCAFLYLSINT